MKKRVISFSPDPFLPQQPFILILYAERMISSSFNARVPVSGDGLLVPLLNSILGEKREERRVEKKIKAAK